MWPPGPLFTAGSCCATKKDIAPETPETTTVSGHKEVISYEGNGVIFITKITPFLFFASMLWPLPAWAHFAFLPSML